MAHAALFVANVIFGVNYSVAKGIMPDYVPPFGFIVLRVWGAVVLFWALAWSQGGSEKVELKDKLRMGACALFGVTLNQLLFFAGLNITTPINASIIMTVNPVLVLIIAAVLIGERITFRKSSGIVLGLSGASILILLGGDLALGESTILGDLLVFINACSYGVYLVIVKPLMRKYKPLTVIKWVFTWGVLFVTPVGLQQVGTVDFASFTPGIWASLLYVIVFTTFLAYLLNVLALKTVNASVASTYLYVQPAVAALVSILVGQDELTWIKGLATLMIFTGVYLVSVRPKIGPVKGE
jgi:drug/metabolite transporter (DMT)-like permease